MPREPEHVGCNISFIH